MFKVEVPEGFCLLVDGPARLEALEGTCRVFGAEFSALDVPQYKRYPVEGPCLLGVRGGSAAFAEGRTVPEEWDVEAQGLILVVGPTDSGKSSLSTYILNRAVEGGRYICVIDADVGQSDIGPPGLIAYSCTAAKTPHISLLEPQNGFFLGSVSLAGLEDLALAGVVSMYAEAASKYPHLVVVNTPGWTSGRGEQFLWSLREALRPTAVLSLGEARLGGLALPTSAAARARSREERAAIRAAQYARYLGGLRRIEADPELARFPCRWERGRLECAWGSYAPADVDAPVREGRTYKVPKGYLRNLLVGLYRGGRLAGFGVATNLGRSIELAAAVEDFDEVRLGKIRLEINGRELEPLP